MDRRTAVPARAGGLPVLLTLLLVMGGAATGLAFRAAHLLSTLPGARAEPYLELLAVTLGALAAVWVGASALVGLGCLAARGLGRSWSAGERLVLRAAPAVVRRAVRTGVGLTVGAGLVLAGGTAHAATPPPDAGPGVVAVDLGWQPSASVPEPAAPEAAPLPPDALSTPTSAHERAEAGVTSPTPDPSGPAPTTAAAHAPAPTAAGASPAASASGAPSAPGTTSAPLPAPTTAAASTPPRTPEDRAATTQQRDAALTVVRDVVVDGPHEVVVVRGDSLWSIAARHLPAGASDAEVADAVQRWYAANAAVVGDDPDLVRPGQVLVAPTA